MVSCLFFFLTSRPQNFVSTLFICPHQVCGFYLQCAFRFLFFLFLCVLNLVVISFFQLMSGLLAASWPKWSEAVCCFQALIVSLPELHCCTICVLVFVCLFGSVPVCVLLFTSMWELWIEVNDGSQRSIGIARSEKSWLKQSKTNPYIVERPFHTCCI